MFYFWISIKLSKSFFDCNQVNITFCLLSCVFILLGSMKNNEFAFRGDEESSGA